MSKPDALLPFVFNKILPQHHEHPQIVLQVMEVLSRSCSSVSPSSSSSSSFIVSQVFVDRLMKEWLDLLAFYQNGSSKASSSSLSPVLMPLILRGISSLISSCSSTVLSLCVQKLENFKNTMDKQMSTLLMPIISTLENQCVSARYVLRYAFS
jgi:hypothetical protein